MFRALIVDDEAPARKRLHKLLRPMEEAGRLEVVGEAADGYEALERLGRHDVDLLFLDIQMPELDGFDVLDRLEPDRRPIVIFVTAYDEYAVRAFDANAVDYLLKPIARERLLRAVARAEKMHRDPEALRLNAERLAELMAWMERRDAPSDEETQEYVRQISIPFRDRILVVPVETIISAEINEGITRLFALEEDDAGRQRVRQHVVNYTLDQFESNLDPKHFMRVHRSALVQLDHIREMISWYSGRYKLVLTGGHEVIASRERSRTLRDRLAL